MNTSSISLRLLAAGAMFALPVALSAQTVFIDYNSASSITDNLTQGLLRNANNPTEYATAGDLSYSAGNGLSGSGAALAPNGYPDNLVYGTKTGFNGNFTTATMGTYVNLNEASISGGGLALTMGFVSLATPESGNGGVSGSSTGIPTPTPLSAANQYSITITMRETTVTDGDDLYNFAVYSNAVQSDSSAQVALSTSSWYYWETIITHSGDNYNMSASLYASDASGTISGGALLTHTVDVENAGLSGEEEIYGLLSSQNSGRRGIEYLDNTSFSAVPEPSQSSLLLGGLVAMLMLAVRRSSARK